MNDVTKDPKIFGHPVGLYICALTEMWERFSFYGMKFLLLLYLTKYHFFTDADGLDVLGSYAGLVYALPLIGGMLADRFLGMRKAVIYGGILLCLGHFGMAFEGNQATETANGVIVRDTAAIQVFYLSLALIVVGVGFLKPNISTIVGRLYTEEDPARDSGFTIFYMGINLGSFLATILCGWLGETYGWRYGFGLAGIGMFFGLLVFIWGQKFLFGHAEPSNPAVLKEKKAGVTVENLIYLGGLVGVFIVWSVIQRHFWVVTIMSITAACFGGWLIYYLIARCNRVQARRMIVLSVLTLSTVVFWALFEQSAASMTQYADRVVDRTVGSFEITASQTGSFNAGFIILLAIPFAAIWVWLAKKGWEPSTPVKFGLGIIQAGLGFGALVIGASMPDEAGKIAMGWLTLAYFLHTTGELCLSPVGLSAVTKLAVPNVVGLMMGAWFLATAFSEKLATTVSKFADVKTSGGEVTDISQALVEYTDLFTFLAWMGIGVGVFMLIISPLLKKGMHGIH